MSEEIMKCGCGKTVSVELRRKGGKSIPSDVLFACAECADAEILKNPEFEVFARDIDPPIFKKPPCLSHDGPPNDLNFLIHRFIHSFCALPEIQEELKARGIAHVIPGSKYEKRPREISDKITINIVIGLKNEFVISKQEIDLTNPYGTSQII